MNGNQQKALDLIVQNTSLSKGEAMYQLNKKEDKIRIHKIQQNHNNYNKSYFYLASALIIGEYK